MTHRNDRALRNLDAWLTRGPEDRDAYCIRCDDAVDVEDLSEREYCPSCERVAESNAAEDLAADELEFELAVGVL